MKKMYILFITCLLLASISFAEAESPKENTEELKKTNSDSEMKKDFEANYNKLYDNYAHGLDNWDPMKDIELLHLHLNNVFHNSIQNMVDNPGGSTYRARADLQEFDDRFDLNIDLPGFDKESINVEFEGGYLNVSGERKSTHEEIDTEKGLHLSERRFGKFQRSIRIPENTKPEKAVARYENGVLRVSIPKKEIHTKSNGVKIKVL